jgi:hypothetical protein
MLSILLLFNLFVLVCALLDTWRWRRLHPTFGWGGLLAIGGLDLAYAGAVSPQWIRFGTAWVS